MRIGIMTFYAAPNHGAALQAYALQTHLRKMGHDPFFINYQHGKLSKKGILKWIGSTPTNTIHKISVQLKKKPFVSFQNKFLKVGAEKYLNHNQLKTTPPIADAYICGSDQIWNPNQIYLGKDEQAYWLDFGPVHTRRIAYAASFGSFRLPDETSKKYAKYAKHFNAISVREESAIKIMKSMGIMGSVWAPDPTLLLEKEEYKNVEFPFLKPIKPILFSYHIEAQERRLNLAKKINGFLCSELDLMSYEALSLSFVFNMVHKRYIGPSQWISMLRQSNFVFTNSFHGTIFSIIFHKPFIVLWRDGSFEGLNSRIESLLKLVGLEHRAIHEFDKNELKELLQENINWDSSDSKIEEFRLVGEKFLRNALQ